MSKRPMKIFAVVSAVFLVFIGSADAGSLFCNNTFYTSNNFDSILGQLPDLTAIIEYQGDNVIITKYDNGNLYQSFNFNANQVAYTKDWVTFENSVAVFLYNKQDNKLIFTNSNKNQVVMLCH